MPLPPGVTTAVVTFGSPASGFGGEEVSTSLTVTPSHSVYHATTGAPLLAFTVQASAGEGLPGSVTLPHTDQAGFLDASGNAFTNWAYTAEGQWRSASGSTIAFRKNFQLPTGQTTVDLDLIPNGTIGLPVTAPTATVTSFLGKTGSIEEADLEDLDLGGAAPTVDNVAPTITTAGATRTAVDNRVLAVGADHYAPLFQGLTPYATGDTVLLPAPVSAVGKRTAAGTSRAAFDATEQALWTVAASGGTTTVDGLTDAGTVGKAVAKAATAAVARDAIGAPSATEARLPTKDISTAFTVTDQVGKDAFAVNADGTLMLGSAKFSDDGVPLDIVGLDNSVAIRVNADGSVIIPDLKSTATPTAVHILIGAGQSNMEGAATPAGGDYDPTDTRIFQYGWNSAVISAGTVPLDMIGVGAGLSPLTVIARDYLRRQSPGTIVLLIPAGKGNSGLTVDAGAGTWDSAVAGNYYTLMIARIAAARAAAQTRWGVTPVVKMFAWHQGETDGMQSVSTATYGTAFDAMVSALRTAVGVADLPIVVGGMSPEWLDGGVNRQQPAIAHAATPVRLTRAGYAPGIRNGGGSTSVTDIIHYHRDGVIELGKAMLDAYDRALNNVAGSIPYPPLKVTGSLIAGELNIEWSAPKCRVTSFTVYWTIDAGTEQSATISTGATSHKVTGIVGTRASLSVATTNPVGTSARTTAVKIGA